MPDPHGPASVHRREALGMLAAGGAAGALFLHSNPVGAGASAPPGGGAVFNVRDFGAEGSWDPVARAGTDDRAAFLEAQAACSANGGGILYLPPGSYGASLGGNGVGTLIGLTDDTHIVFDPAAVLHVISTDLETYRVIEIGSGAANVSVRFARIVGDADTNTSAGTDHRAVSTAASTDVGLFWCEFSRFRGSQVAIGDGSLASHTTIEGCLFTGAHSGGAARAGLEVFDASGVTVSNSTFTGAQSGLHAGSAAGATSRSLRVFACQFEANTTGISLDASTEDVEVFANTVVNNTGVGVSTAASDGSVTANSIRGNGGHGIAASGTQTIVGNSIVANGGYGIDLAASNSLVVGNRTANNTSGTINDTGAGNLVNNNL